MTSSLFAGPVSMSTTTSKFARAFSIRDKKTTTLRPSSEANLFSHDESSKRLNKDELQKVQDISLQLSRLGNNTVPESRIQYALRSKSAQGDVKEAMRLLLLYEDSIAGVLRRYDPTIKLLGAENWEKTTCWLDALLFAMFAQTDVFEAVLHKQYEDEERKQLVNSLRLWVNMLRSGKLIPIDLTRRLQQAIAECGWPEAAKPRQQDASEAFNFITDKLSLPLLTLKTDIYHQGKEDANDDHKFITERMLDVAIPENIPQGEVLKLESCLEDYFNNRVEVKRHLARRKTLDASDLHSDEKSGASHVEVAEVDSSRANSPAPSEEHIQKSANPRPLHMRQRATSIFSERKLNLSKPGLSNGDTKDADGAANAKKEVLMPAWQFLNLIPWYTDNVPEGDNQVRSHFSQKRLMLGICIKRYGMTNNGRSFRRSTHIDIPLEMASPHFTTGDQVDNEGTDASDFKLVLKSFVCHRGHSVDAGHYIAFVRVEATNQDRRESFAEATTDTRPDQSHDVWLKLDDLAEERVSTVDIHRALREESPYLLFYRVQAIKDDPADETPPPYQESETSLDYVDQKLAHLEAQDQVSTDRQSSRPSIEVTSAEEIAPSRPSLSERQPSCQAPSTVGSLSIDQTPSETPEDSRNASIAVSRQQTRTQKTEGRQSDELSRRFSMSMSKLAARLSRDKLNNPDILVNEITDDSVGLEKQDVIVVDERIHVVAPTTSPMPPVKKELSPFQEAALLHEQDQSGQNSRPSTKDKKKKFKINGRRGSNVNGTKPERECVVM